MSVMKPWSWDIWLESQCTCTADLWVCTEDLHNLSQELVKLFWGSRIILWASRPLPTHYYLPPSIHSAPKKDSEIRAKGAVGFLDLTLLS